MSHSLPFIGSRRYSCRFRVSASLCLESIIFSIMVYETVILWVTNWDGDLLHLLVGSEGRHHLFTWFVKVMNTRGQRQAPAMVVMMGAQKEVRLHHVSLQSYLFELKQLVLFQYTTLTRYTYIFFPDSWVHNTTYLHTGVVCLFWSIRMVVITLEWANNI